MKWSPKLLLAIIVPAVVLISCSKVPLTNPPIPIGVLKDLEQFPFQSYIDSLNGLKSDSIDIYYVAGAPFDQLVMHEEIPGQAEYAYAFRTSVPGAVTSLGVLEPASGYSHTVTLWDSATGAVLAQADVPSLDSGHWTYVSLALTGQEVPVQANHGYIVGFNTLALGSAIGAGTPGDWTYFINGIWDFQDNPAGNGGLSTIQPFTSKGCTFEGEYLTYYNANTPLVGPPFPGGLNNPNGDPNHNLYGACDVGFIPASQ